MKKEDRRSGKQNGDWKQLEKEAAVICQDFGEGLNLLVTYLEELALIRVCGRSGPEEDRWERWWEIEARPLLEIVSDIYENTEIEIEEEDERWDVDRSTAAERAYKNYADRFLQGAEEKLSEIFENTAAFDTNQTIDLEVSVRHTDCVRVIRMNLDDSLYVLHDAIQRAVSFDDDHLFSFTVEAEEAFLEYCGVVEMEVLYAEVKRFLKRKMDYDDFALLLYSRLHYFGGFHSVRFQETEYMSRYDPEMTQRILEERGKSENAAFAYPRLEQICDEEPGDFQRAMRVWNEYIHFNLFIDWQTAERLGRQVPALAASGILEKEEVLAAYKEMLRGTGSRVTKRAEGLIGELCSSMPLAVRRGNVGGKEPVREEDASPKSGKATAAQERKGRENDKQKNGKANVAKEQKGRGNEKEAEDEYKQLGFLICSFQVNLNGAWSKWMARPLLVFQEIPCLRRTL